MRILLRLSGKTEPEQYTLLEDFKKHKNITENNLKVVLQDYCK